MTENSEIKIISTGIFQSGDRLDAEYIESILEENNKLKAEIEQLKSELEQLSKQYSNVESLYHKYYNLYKKGQV